jgi:peptide/nickel transport system substrate-binding protein
VADNYWIRTLEGRMTRRRAVALVGGSALGAAFLAACGGGGSDSGSSGSTADKTSLITKTEDSKAQAKKGGILKDRTNGDAPSFAVHEPIAPLNNPAKHVYSTMVRLKAPHLQAPQVLEMSPDFAESWEVAPDGLTITFKLRANAKFQNKAPVNGRAADSSDVAFTWARYSATAPLRGLSANSANPNAPVLSITPTDARTVAVKLKEPLTYALELFASFGSFSGNIAIIPKEADGGFDIRREMIGTGPYYLDNYTPSVGFTMKRNDNYWDPQANLLDQINYPIIIDNSQVEAQLKAGNMHYFQAGLRAENVFTLKKDEPRLNIYAMDLQTASTVMTFGQLPEGRNPFSDERVRQAYSMSWDRKAWVDAMYNVPQMEAGGLATDERWNSALPADFGTEWWLDPQGKDFGPNAKYYQFNPDEAKKLLAAAGRTGGFSYKSNRITSNLVADLARYAEALEAMVLDTGFKTEVVAEDYNTVYIPKIRDGNGQYEGVGWHTVTGTTPWRMAPASALAAEYWSKAGATFKGFSANGKNDKSGDPAVDSLIEKARLEKDAKKRQAYVYDAQRHLAKTMYGLINPGTATTFALAWPAVRNYQTYRHIGASGWTHYGVWLDESKPPFTQ